MKIKNREIFFSFLTICFLLSSNIISITAKDVTQNNSFPAKTGRIIYVDNDSPGGDGTKEHPYHYIVDGIDESRPGDTVYVFNGTYHENVYLNKSIILMGENKETTIVFPYYEGDNFKITADNVTVSGFTIANAGHFCPNIKMWITSDYCTITDNIFTDYTLFDCRGGIILEEGKHNIISENLFYSSYILAYIQFVVAIRLINSTYNIIRKNTITDYLGGILLSNSSNNIVDYNKFYASSSVYESDNNTIQYNTFNSYFSVIRSYNNTISPENNFVIMDFNDSSNNDITKNNFIRYGLILYYKLKRPQIIFQDSDDFFDHNYWGRPRLFPMVLFGYNGTEHVIEVDWHPTIKPN